MSRVVARFDPAVILDLQLRVERDGVVPFEYVNSAGDPLDQTGNTFEMVLRKKAGGDPVITLSTVSGEITIANHLVTVEIDQSLSNIRPDQYFWEMIVTRSSKKKNDFTGVAYVVNDSYREY